LFFAGTTAGPSPALTPRRGRNADAVNAEFQRLGPSVALDAIAWAAVAVLRTEGLRLDIPEPNLLERPGWYIEPVFGQAERYWDGSDWTDRCRIPDRNAYREGDFPLS
jgi:hypothetical protein